MMQGAIPCKNGNTSSFSRQSQAREASFVRALPMTRNSTIGKKVQLCTTMQTDSELLVGSFFPVTPLSLHNQTGNHLSKPNRFHRICGPSRWFSNDPKMKRMLLLASWMLSIASE